MQINDRETGSVDGYHRCRSICETIKRELRGLTGTLVDMLDSTVIPVVEKPSASLC